MPSIQALGSSSYVTGFVAQYTSSVGTGTSLKLLADKAAFGKIRYPEVSEHSPFLGVRSSDSTGVGWKRPPGVPSGIPYPAGQARDFRQTSTFSW